MHCLDHHQRQLHWLQFYWYWMNSYLDLLSFVAVICNENQKHLWCYLLLPSHLQKIPLLRSQGWCVKCTICHGASSYNTVGVLASPLPCLFSSAASSALRFYQFWGLFKLLVKVKGKNIISLAQFLLLPCRVTDNTFQYATYGPSPPPRPHLV